MVQQIVDEEHWAPEWKTAVNYWFRHVVEYWWPIYRQILPCAAVMMGFSLMLCAIFRMLGW